MSKKLLDEGARRRIKEDLDRTLFVEAGAGSGKTKSLVDRMIALLSAGKCTVGKLAAVTFTRKAAAELRGRFQIGLEKAVIGEADPVVRDRLRDALRNLEQCTIGTIHSFCAKLLRERPIEIGLDPSFTELEDIDDAIFRAQCWQDYLVKVRIEGEEVMRGLDEAGVSPQDLEDAFDTVSLYPEVEIAGGRKDIPDYQKHREKLERFLDRAREAVPRDKPVKGFDKLQKLMRRCFVRQRNLGFDDHRVLMETFELLEKDTGVTQNRWPSKEAALAFKDEFDGFRERVVTPALKAWREYRHDRIIRFLRPAVAFFGSRRKEENKLNFGDLLMLAATLLRENSEVRRYFSGKFTRMLVDEFQDTDPIQAEVLMYLKGEDREEREWQKLRPEPGSLFLVGDPKQSIYRFRRADIDIYNCVKGIVDVAGGGELSLTTNFRSLGALADWNNPIWKAVFPEKATQYQAGFAPIEIVRGHTEGCAGGVHKIVVPKVKYNKGEEIAGADAAMIAEYIRWACTGALKINYGDTYLNSKTNPTNQAGKLSAEGIKLGVTINERPARPSDFLILFRYKKNMDLYARALEERGIPFEITGSDAFSESEEIHEITNLALALNDPDNPIYTVAVLRGVFCGASDEDLVEFKRQGGRFSYLSPGLDILKSKHVGATHVLLGMQNLKTWRDLTLRLPASAALHKIFEESGIINYLVSKEMGSSRAGNILKLLEIVRNEERKGETSFARVVKLLEELAEEREIEEMSLTPARENAVRLMNLHKAKGLEAPVVFLANPAPSRDHEVDKHVVRIQPGDVPQQPGDVPQGDVPQGDILKRDTSGKMGDRQHISEFRGHDPNSRELGHVPKFLEPATHFHVARFLGVGPKGYFAFHKPGTFQAKGALISHPVGWDEAVEEEKKYQDAEEQRLMYVAATRARDMLIISTYGGDAKNKPWKTLDAALGGVPELEWPHRAALEEDGAEGRREKVVVTKVELKRAREAIKANCEEAAQPSYQVETVTSLAKKEREAPARKHDSGLGLSWGRLVHQVLEAVGSGRLRIPAIKAKRKPVSPSPSPIIPSPLAGEGWGEGERANLELFVENLLAAEEGDYTDKEMLIAHVKSIVESEFWQRIMRAERRYFEIPFSIRTTEQNLADLKESHADLSGSGLSKTRPKSGKKNALGAKAGRTGKTSLPVILSGTIDLVFWEETERGRGRKETKGGASETDAGWVIVDYKTDYIRPQLVEDDLADLVNIYAPQIRLYARFWSQTTGDPIKEAGLYFTSIDRWVKT
jgi:ATP-dependent helicase/nuclease subunit A